MRRAFTIIELLVVIGILALLMGLTLGAFFNHKTDKLVVTEHLVADMIRQAKHTARTSGHPVVIRITAADRTISGVARAPVWWENFESGPQQGHQDCRGWSGRGYQIAENGPGDPLTRNPLRIDLGATDATKPGRGTRIIRSERDGFYIGCRVRPPLAQKGMSPQPLLMIGSEEQDEMADAQRSLAGLALWPVERTLQSTKGLEPTPGGTPPDQPKLVTWEIVGWMVDDATGKVYEISSIDPDQVPQGTTRETPVLHPTLPQSTEDEQKASLDVAWPMNGGSWEDLGLLWDGSRLILYRNGLRVAELDPGKLSQPQTLTPRRMDREWLRLGRNRLSPNPADPVITNFSCIFDDVTVQRLLTAEPRSLPIGITIAADQRIVCHPEGRVDAPTLVFTGANDEAVSIEIASDGSLKSAFALHDE